MRPLLVIMMFAAGVLAIRHNYEVCDYDMHHDGRNYHRGKELLCSDGWDVVQDNAIYWHTFGKYDSITGGFPYFMFTYRTNLSISEVIDIEINNYTTTSACWIPQLINGKVLSDGTERLLYDFTPFTNRVVYQRWLRRPLDGVYGFQYYIYTIDREDPNYITMDEDVHKFIYHDESCNCTVMVYVGAENPKGWLRPWWGLNHLYRAFYIQHYNKQMKCMGDGKLQYGKIEL